jgi:hypothetical protein
MIDFLKFYDKVLWLSNVRFLAGKTIRNSSWGTGFLLAINIKKHHLGCAVIIPRHINAMLTPSW